MNHLRMLFLFLPLLAGVAAGSSAQSVPSSPDSTLVSILNQLEGAPLTLTQAIRYTVESSPSLRIAEAGLAGARGVVRRESGAFDPEAFLLWDYADQRIPSASFFAGASVLRTIQGTGSAGVKWTLPFGTSLEALINALRLNTNSSFAFLSPQYTTVGSLSFRQPLLRGFASSARKSLTGAEQQLESARVRYDQEVLTAGTQVEHFYWDLYAGVRDYAVQKLTRDRAAFFLKETELRARTGLVGPNQLANARTFLAEQEILLLDREEQLDGLSDRLAAAIGVRPPAGQVRFKAVDQPRGDYPPADAEALVEEAMARNLELRAAKSEIDARRTLAKAAAWEALPRIDLVGGIGGNGLTGTSRDVVFGSDTLRTSVGGEFGDAVSQALRREFPTWHVGVEVNVPIGFRRGFGEQDRLEAEVTIAEQRYAAEQRILETEVREGCRELSHGQRRLSAAREGVAAAQEQVRIGLIEFQNGRSTAFELVRLGGDFAAAQQRYSQAVVRSAKAAASLRQLTSGGYNPEEQKR